MDQPTKIMLTEIRKELETIQAELTYPNSKIEQLELVCDHMRKELHYYVHKNADLEQKIFFLEEEILLLKSGQ